MTTDNVREKIARIIDPDMWKTRDYLYGLPDPITYAADRAVEHSLIKADAILTALEAQPVAPQPDTRDGEHKQDDRDPLQGCILDAFDAAIVLAFVSRGVALPIVWSTDLGRDLQALAENTLAALSQPSQDGWRFDMENAPRDRDFLAAYNDGRVVTAFYLDNSHTTHPWMGFRPRYGSETATSRFIAWRPLPPPPAKEGR